MAQVSENFCTRLVEYAVHTCTSAPGTAAPPTNFDALATSFGGLSMATAWVAVAITGLAVVVAGVGLAWGRVLVKETKADAREEARTEARKILEAWLLNEATPLIREAVASLDGRPRGSIGAEGAAEADEMGRAAG